MIVAVLKAKYCVTLWEVCKRQTARPGMCKLDNMGELWCGKVKMLAVVKGRRRWVNRGDGRLLLPRPVGQRERDLCPEIENGNENENENEFANGIMG